MNNRAPGCHWAGEWAVPWIIGPKRLRLGGGGWLCLQRRQQRRRAGPCLAASVYRPPSQTAGCLITGLCLMQPAGGVGAGRDSGGTAEKSAAVRQSCLGPVHPLIDRKFLCLTLSVCPHVFIAGLKGEIVPVVLCVSNFQNVFLHYCCVSAFGRACACVIGGHRKYSTCWSDSDLLATLLVSTHWRKSAPNWAY